MTDTALVQAADWRLHSPDAIRIDVVVPVLNEAHVLAQSIHKLHRFLGGHVPYRWAIVIAENGSTDGTAEVGRRLCRELDRVDLLVVGRPGRGRALRMAWSGSTADVVCYTDVDLSTELEAFPRLFHAVVADRYDVAVGSRRLPGSRTTRSLKREIISSVYNRILKLTLRVGFSDAQAGFKAVTHEVVQKVLPLVVDQSWFLDTELLVLAERLGYRIADIPVAWVEDDDSRVRIVRTAWDDLRGVARVARFLRERGLDHPELVAARPHAERESTVH